MKSFHLLSHVYHLAVVHPYCMLRTCYPMWYYVVNQEGRRRHHANLPHLDAVQMRIVRDLQKQGIALAHIDELFPAPSLLTQLQEYTQKSLQHAAVKSGKSFLEFIWDLKPIFDFKNPFLSFVLDQKILDIVNTYMGLWAKFYYFSLNRTMPVAQGAKPMQSQRWHRDPEDKKLCKVFLYLNDVRSEAGPFEYVMGSHYGGSLRSLFPQRPPHGCRAPFGEVERRVGSSQIRSCTGKAGTIIFCDTSGLHRGGYARSQHRLMFTGVYASAASYKYTANPGFTYPDNFGESRDNASISDTARYALMQLPHTWVQRLEKKMKSFSDAEY